MFHYQFCVRGK